MKPTVFRQKSFCPCLVHVACIHQRLKHVIFPNAVPISKVVGIRGCVCVFVDCLAVIII